MKLLDFAKMVSKFIEDDNAKDGVRVIIKPTHAFQCISCGKVHTFKYDAMKCKHGEISSTETIGVST